MSSLETFFIMGSLWIPMCFLVVVFAMTANTSASANQTQLSSSKEKCHNIYTSNNFYAGPSKKVEALLHEVKNELNEIKEEIKSIRGNKTTRKGE